MTVVVLGIFFYISTFYTYLQSLNPDWGCSKIRPRHCSQITINFFRHFLFFQFFVSRIFAHKRENVFERGKSDSKSQSTRKEWKKCPSSTTKSLRSCKVKRQKDPKRWIWRSLTSQARLSESFSAETLSFRFKFYNGWKSVFRGNLGKYISFLYNLGKVERELWSGAIRRRGSRAGRKSVRMKFRLRKKFITTIYVWCYRVRSPVIL